MYQHIHGSSSIFYSCWMMPFLFYPFDYLLITLFFLITPSSFWIASPVSVSAMYSLGDGKERTGLFGIWPWIFFYFSIFPGLFSALLRLPSLYFPCLVISLDLFS